MPSSCWRTVAAASCRSATRQRRATRSSPYSTTSPVDRRCAIGPTRQPLDDLGTDRRTLPRGVRRTRDRIGLGPRPCCVRSARRHPGARPSVRNDRRHRPLPARRPFGAAPTDIASMTTPAACFSPCPSRRSARNSTGEHDPIVRALQHAFNRQQAVPQFHELRSPVVGAAGSEDSHGRTLWSLGAVARHDTCAARRRWAAALFAEALPVVEGFGSPRAWVFTLLGLDPYYVAMPCRQPCR